MQNHTSGFLDLHTQQVKTPECCEQTAMGIRPSVRSGTYKKTEIGRPKKLYVRVLEIRRIFLWPTDDER